MLQTVTLQLPDEVAQRAKITAERTGQSLETVLVEWLTREAADSRAFDIYTPYGNDEAAQILAKVLEDFKQSHNHHDETL